ncbi:MAG: neutral zinc metallopeptidase [Thermocrispum sp.]
MNRARGVIVIAAVLLSVAGCADDPTVPQAPVVPVAKAELVTLPTSASCTVDGDLEGRFTASAQMPAYLECVLPAIVQWQGSVYRQMPSPQAFRFVPAGFTGNDSGCAISDQNLQYCKPSRTVYLGEAAVWDQYTRFGDAAPAVIAAHELTHHFQEIMQMPKPTVPNEAIRYENQADCGAGAFMAYARAQGWLNVEDDIVDLAGALKAAGQTDGPQRTHGTIDERLQSFDLAYLSQGRQPLADCVSFVPEVPILN